MDTDTAGNPIYRPSAYCSWCCGPTDTAGRCRNGCENGVAVVVASSLDTAEKQLAQLREENARLKARLVEMYERIIPEEIAKGLERLTRERDDLRAEVKP